MLSALTHSTSNKNYTYIFLNFIFLQNLLLTVLGGEKNVYGTSIIYILHNMSYFK